jgi:hypothetical protein
MVHQRERRATMRVFLSLLVVLVAVPRSHGYGSEKVITPDLSTIVGGKGWEVHNAIPEAVEVEGKRAVRLKATGDSANGIVGLVLAEGVEFTTGVIEIDLKGKNVRGRSFLGVAFNVTDEETFEAIYFRPFNFKADGEFKSRAVQYLAWPKHTWEELRKKQPGKFEGPVSSVSDPDKWFHARIEVGETKVRVFANEAKEPCLTVDRLAKNATGRRMGLFVDSADGLYAGLKITPTK